MEKEGLKYEKEQLCEGVEIFQCNSLYKFTNDAVLLADFADIKHLHHVVDFGSGSGVVSFLVAKMYSPKSVCGVEIQKCMFDMSVASLEHCGISGVSFVHGRIQDVGKMFPAKVDVVISNPPYFETVGKDVCKNDVLAIARSEVEIDISELCVSAGKILKDKGRFVLCFPVSRISQLVSSLVGAGFGIKRLQFARAEGKRPHILLCEAIYRSSPETVVEEDIIIKG